WCAAENRLDRRLLALPELRGRQMDDDVRHERGEDQCRKSCPDTTPVARVTVDLRQDVAEDIGDRKEQHACHEGDRPYDRHLHGGDFRRPDEIRAEQHADIGAEDEVVVSVALHLSDLRREMISTAINTTAMLSTHQADMP